MRIFERVKLALLFVWLFAIVFASCQDKIEQNGTKTVALQDPNVDATVKSALENGTVSEVVVRKDLLLFPVNAPNLVIAHSQEIHAVPQNDTNDTDGKPTAAQVAEVNEYSLSQLVNSTDNNSASAPQSYSVPASAFPSDSQSNSVLEPGKLLEIISGFNLSNGVATEKVPLPDAVQNISLPKQSITDLLSKSLPQNTRMTTTTAEPLDYYNIVKRSAEESSEEEKNNTESTGDTSSIEKSNDSDSSNATIEKRSSDSDEDESEDDYSNDAKEDNDNSTTESNATNITNVEKRSVDSEQESDGDDVKKSESSKGSSNSAKTASTTDSIDVGKRSAEADEDEDDSTSNRTEYYDHVE